MMHSLALLSFDMDPSKAKRANRMGTVEYVHPLAQSRHPFVETRQIFTSPLPGDLRSTRLVSQVHLNLAGEVVGGHKNSNYAAGAGDNNNDEYRSENGDFIEPVEHDITQHPSYDPVREKFKQKQREEAKERGNGVNSCFIERPMSMRDYTLVDYNYEDQFDILMNVHEALGEYVVVVFVFVVVLLRLHKVCVKVCMYVC